MVLAFNFSFFLILLILILFFPLSFSPLIPPSTSNHHTIFHAHESIFPFSQSLSPSPHQLSFALHLRVCLHFIFSSVCSLHSTYDWVWMDLENIMLSEISQSENNKYHMISLVFSLYFWCWHYYRCLHSTPSSLCLTPPSLHLPLPSGHHHTCLCL